MPSGLLPSDNKSSSNDEVYDDKFEQDEKNKGQLNAAESPQSIARQEASPWTTSVGKTGRGGSLAKQEQSAKSGAGFAYNPSDGASSPIRQKFKGMVTKKKGIIGGTVITGTILSIMGLSNLGGVELIHARSNLLGRGNKLANSVMERRQGPSFGSFLKKQRKGDTQVSKLDGTKFKEKMEAQGFKVTLDKNNKLIGFADGVSGREFNLNEPSTIKAYSDFFAGDSGRGSLKRIGTVVPQETATWRGFGGAKVYKLIGTRLNNWLHRTPSDKAKNDKEKLSDNLRHADDAKPVEHTAADVPATKDPSGNPVPPGTDVSATGDTAAYRDTMLNDPAATDINNIKDITGTSTGGIDPTTNGDFGDAATPVIDDATTAVKNSGRAAGDAVITKALPNLTSKLPKKTLGAASGGLNVLSYESSFCRLKGTLNFIANARNVMVSLELARFVVKIITAADHTKAHLTSADELKLLMIYLHNPDPHSGKTYSQAGGFANVWMGNKAAKPSSTNNAAYTMNRNQAGVLGSINKFVNNVPGVSNPKTCRIANNGFVQVGGMALGVVLAFASGGGSVVAGVAKSVTVQLMEEAAYQIATPLLIKAGAKMLLNGTEFGEQAGDALGSGGGVLKAMNGNANGLRPATKAKAAALNQQLGYEQRRDMASKSLFARYLDLYNGESLLSNVASAASTNTTFGSFRGLISNNLINPLSSIGGLAGRFSSTAYAAEQTCDTDPAISKFDAEADVFCNPEVFDSPNIDPEANEAELKSKNQIDANGEPVPGSEYDEYVKDCHSGRPSILYTLNVDKGGNNDQIDEKCFVPGGEVPHYQGSSSPPSTTPSTPTSPTPPPNTPPSVPGLDFPCTEDGVSGKRYQLVYAYIEGQPNNMDSLRPKLQAWASEVNKTIVTAGQTTGSARYVRFVHDAAPACLPDIKAIALPASIKTDHATKSTMDAIQNAGSTEKDRKYLVWVDKESPIDCGQGSNVGDDKPGPDNNNDKASTLAVVWKNCWGSNYGGQPVYAEIHELLHTLGAVNKTAPHASSDGHCTDGVSVLCLQPSPADGPYSTVCPTIQLDCNFDDYFNTDPKPGSYLATHWNTANSAFLSKTATVDGGGNIGGKKCNDLTPVPARDLAAGTEEGFCKAHGGLFVASAEQIDTVAQGYGGDSLIYHPLGEQPKPSVWARLTGQKAVAQAPPTSGQFGAYEKYSAYIGTHQDIQNTICLINNDGFCDEANPPDASAAPPTAPPAAGSSLIDYPNIGNNSDTIPCAAGTKLLGVVTTKYTADKASKGLKTEAGPLKINLCQVPDIPGQGNNTAGAEINGGITVNSRVSAAWQALATKAKTDPKGVKLSATSSFRLDDSCGGTGKGTLCATPGASMHQLGIAVDFAMTHQYGDYSSKDCSKRNTMKGNPMWDWLDQNAPAFGIKQYSYENWHWDPFQDPSRCANGPSAPPGGETPGAPGAPAPSGNSQDLAKQILANPKITLSGRGVKNDITAASLGKNGSNNVPTSSAILRFIVAIGQSSHTVTISAIQGAGSGHTSGSLHYTGDAVDFNVIDGVGPPAKRGRNPGDIAVIMIGNAVLPPGSGYGQSLCGTTPPLPPSFRSFPDTCSHLHVEVPRGTP